MRLLNFRGWLKNESPRYFFDLPNLHRKFAFFGDEYSVRVQFAQIFLSASRFAVLIPVTGAFVNVYAALHSSAYNIAHKYIFLS